MGGPEFFFTGDTHFGHLLLSNLRGFGNDTTAHDAALIDAWNSRVKPGDVVWHLGDFMLPQRQDYAERLLATLHGQKHLVQGNHERNPTTRAKGWTWVGDYRYKRVEDIYVSMSHYAFRTWPQQWRGSFHLHGHSHGSLPPFGRSMDVGVDTREDFTPWHFHEVRSLLLSVEVEAPDYHEEEEA